MPKNDESGPCFIVLGIVAAAADWVMLNTTYVMVFGFFFIFIGIMTSISAGKKASQTQKTQVKTTQGNTTQVKKTIDVPPINQMVQKENTYEIHEFCPYCGISTSLAVCPGCNKKID